MGKRRTFARGSRRGSAGKPGMRGEVLPRPRLEGVVALNFVHQAELLRRIRDAARVPRCPSLRWGRANRHEFAFAAAGHPVERHPAGRGPIEELAGPRISVAEPRKAEDGRDQMRQEQAPRGSASASAPRRRGRSRGTRRGRIRRWSASGRARRRRFPPPQARPRRCARAGGFPTRPTAAGRPGRARALRSSATGEISRPGNTGPARRRRAGRRGPGNDSAGTEEAPDRREEQRRVQQAERARPEPDRAEGGQKQRIARAAPKLDRVARRVKAVGEVVGEAEVARLILDGRPVPAGRRDPQIEQKEQRTQSNFQ